MSDIKLPDLGEGVSGGIVAALSVQVGDSVAANDPIIEIETDKAVLPVPAPEDGVIASFNVAAGDKINVGEVIASFASGAAAQESPAADVAAPSPTVEAVSATGGAAAVVPVILPDLGEGVSGGIVAAVSAEVGDELSEGDPILEIETDKAVLPVPSPAAGALAKVHVAAGDKINVGDVIADLSTSAAAAPAAVAEAPQPKAEQQAGAPATPAPAPAARPSAPAPGVGKGSAIPGASVPAGPATRKLARELGIDLSVVSGSGRGGRVKVEDVKAHVKALNLGSKESGQAGAAPAASAPKADWPSLPDPAKFGPVKREKLSNLRNIISERMSMCWNRIPHVFQFNELDLTELGQFQKRYKEDFKARGSSCSPTNFIIKAMAICLKEFPQFNACLDEETGEIVYKEYVNIGVAVDTPTGLIVPVLKDVDQMTIFQIGKDLKELAKRTRDRKVTQEDLSGGCMTLSNLGGIGGTHFTPIVNWPEVAILGVGKSEVKPRYIDGEVQPRTMAQFTLSYDHRVIDGADGARFMVRLTEILENIERTLMGG